MRRHMGFSCLHEREDEGILLTPCTVAYRGCRGFTSARQREKEDFISHDSQANSVSFDPLCSQCFGAELQLETGCGASILVLLEVVRVSLQHSRCEVLLPSGLIPLPDLALGRNFFYFFFYSPLFISGMDYFREVLLFSMKWGYNTFFSTPAIMNSSLKVKEPGAHSVLAFTLSV